MDPRVLTGPRGELSTEMVVIGDLLRFLNSPRAFCRRHRVRFDEHVRILHTVARGWAARNVTWFGDKAERGKHRRFMRPDVRSSWAEDEAVGPEARKLAQVMGGPIDELPRPAHLIKVHRSFGHEYMGAPTAYQLFRHNPEQQEAWDRLSWRQRRVLQWVKMRLHLLHGKVRRCDIPGCRTPGGRIFLGVGRASACPLCRKRYSPKQRWILRQGVAGQ